MKLATDRNGLIIVDLVLKILYMTNNLDMHLFYYIILYWGGTSYMIYMEKN